MDHNSRTSSRAGSWWLAGLGLALALAGTVFVWMLWTAWQRAEETRRWTPVPCRVLSSQLKTARPTPNSPPMHRVTVRYEYVWQGKTFTSEHIRRVDGPKSDLDAAEELREQFGPGQQTTCFVNPADPAFAGAAARHACCALHDLVSAALRDRWPAHGLGRAQGFIAVQTAGVRTPGRASPLTTTMPPRHVVQGLVTFANGRSCRVDQALVVVS